MLRKPARASGYHTGLRGLSRACAGFMPSLQHYLAIDLGAESGRLMVGTLRRGRLSLQEVHRFANIPVRRQGSLVWNFPQIMKGIRVGLRKAAALQPSFESLSVTAWGVDYVLFDTRGRMMPPVYHYRDARTARGVRSMHSRVSYEDIFAETGIQFMPLNSVYQLAAESPSRRRRARRVLPIADAVGYLLSGRPRTEESAASTTALYDPRSRTWSPRLARASGWTRRQLGVVIPSGRVLGPLRPAFAKAAGLRAQVIAGCSHDTACAVVAVPVPVSAGRGWAYLSSGTWSLMGVERARPVFSAACRRFNFTNEIGYDGRIRLLKNIIGLWLVQECRRAWARQGREYDYATLTRLASESAPFVSLIQPADPRFLAPTDMPRAIADFCRETGQPVPDSPGAYVRCALESLALIYRQTLQELEEVTGTRLRQLHIVGGGSRNALLNQFTADALGIPVIAGPEEATAAGNVLVQALALKHLRSLGQARTVVQRSFATVRFEPRNPAAWRGPWERFRSWSRPRD